MKKKKSPYEGPQCEVIEINTQHVIAVSGIDTTTNPWEGSTEQEW